MNALIFERLGPRSRIQRFLGPKPELPEHDLSALSAVDGSRHFGVIAFAGSPESPVGVARYVRSDEDFEVAETAIEVVDEWQRRGVGRLLLAALRARALEAGVRRFEWFALDSNRAGAPLVARPFFNVLTGAEDAQVIAAPGRSFGGIDVFSDSRFWGAEGNLRTNCWCGPYTSGDLLGGYRHLQLDETLNVSGATASRPCGTFSSRSLPCASVT